MAEEARAEGMKHAYKCVFICEWLCDANYTYTYSYVLEQAYTHACCCKWLCDAKHTYIRT